MRPARPDRSRAHPPLWPALAADARVTAALRGERHLFRSRLDTLVQIVRLAAVSDAFLGQALYRAKARLQSVGVPILPRLLHHLAVLTAGIQIGDRVYVWPGLYIVHGRVVIDGAVEIHAGAVISPAVTIGPEAPGKQGPTIGPASSIGTGARVLGAVTIGARARIGANAVVLADVPAAATVAGIPAHVVGPGPAAAA